MLNLKIIGQGRTADIFEYEEGKIIKLFKQEFPEDAINQEFLVSKFVHSLGIKIPQPFELTQLDSRFGIVFERMSGTTLLHEMTSKPWLINKQSRKLARLQYELHCHPAHDAVEELRYQKSVLVDNIQLAPLLTEDEKEQIKSYLKGLPDDNKLCHGDFHPDNVLIGSNSCIIDWMTGMIGNPAGDVARTVILLSFGTLPNETCRTVKLLISYLRNRIKTAYLKQYLKLTGREFKEIDRWILPVAAARLIECIPDEEKRKLIVIIRKRLQAIS